jgi:hypothetical protein
MGVWRAQSAAPALSRNSLNARWFSIDGWDGLRAVPLTSLKREKEWDGTEAVPPIRWNALPRAATRRNRPSSARAAGCPASGRTPPAPRRWRGIDRPAPAVATALLPVSGPQPGADHEPLGRPDPGRPTPPGAPAAGVRRRPLAKASPKRLQHLLELHI